MVMKTINIKLDDEFLKEIDEIVKRENYQSRTEFIREAIRDKIRELKKAESKAKHI